MSYSQQLIAERYRLASQIGAGGMGRVWLARDEVLHRDVAVKEVVLPPELSEAERDELFQRTLREARAAGRLNHPNVVAVHDVVQAEGRPWIVMELVRSRSLYQAVREDGPLSPKRTAEIGLSVLAGLRAAHAAGVWHRDVKPGNVLLADDGRVVLSDFGLATFDGDGTVTRSGIILGSAQYISPERAREGSSGPEADMWSLGATLYAAVEGRSPFARETSMATLTALATEPPDPPRRAGTLRPVLIGLLRKNPRHRMRAEETEKLLQRIAAGNAVGRKAGRIPAQRGQDEANEDSGAPAAPPVATGAAIAGERSPGPRTVTEETFRQVVKPKTKWLLISGLVGLVAALVAPAVIILATRNSAKVASPAAVSPSVPTASPTPALTEAMRVQACPSQSLADQATMPPSAPEDSDKYGPLDKFTRFADPSGFTIHMPRNWTVSRIGKLVCFRDPASAKTAAVFSHGRLDGDPLDLIRNTTAWEKAADMPEFVKVSIRDRDYPEGAAELEYTYQGPVGKMRGSNLMMRMNGQVYTIYYLATDASWFADQEFKNVIQPSFTLAD